MYFLLGFVFLSLVVRSVFYIVVVVLEMLWIHQVLYLYLFWHNSLTLWDQVIVGGVPSKFVGHSVW